MFETVALGTRRALDFALACRSKKVLFISSGAVYGRQPPDLSHVSEDYQGGPDTLNPLSAYAEGKRAAEFLVLGLPAKARAGSEGCPLLFLCRPTFAAGYSLCDRELPPRWHGRRSDQDQR